MVCFFIKANSSINEIPLKNVQKIVFRFSEIFNNSQLQIHHSSLKLVSLLFY